MKLWSQFLGNKRCNHTLYWLSVLMSYIFLGLCPFKSNGPKAIYFVSFCVCRIQRINSSQQSTLPLCLFSLVFVGMWDLFKRLIFDFADPLCRVTQHSITDWKSVKCLLLIYKVVTAGTRECLWKHYGM